MVRRLSTVAAFVALLAAPASAQQPAPPPAAAASAPVSTRCGGLFCDIYYAGKPAPAPGQPDIPSPTALPCHDFLCAAFGGRTPDAPPPVAQAEPAPMPAPAATPKHRRKAHRTVASAEPVKAPANP